MRISFPDKYVLLIPAHGLATWAPRHSVDLQMRGPGCHTVDPPNSKLSGLATLFPDLIFNPEGTRAADLSCLEQRGSWGKAQAVSTGYHTPRLRGVLLGPSARALASAVRGRGQTTALEEGRCGFRLAHVPLGRWAAARLPLSPSFGGSTNPHFLKAMVLLLEISGCYEDVMRSVYRALQGLHCLEQ